MTILGKKDYHAYINSVAWWKKRQRYWASGAPKDCYVCGAEYRKGFHLHHRTYKRLGDENIGVDLVPVCEPCHERIHEIARQPNMDLWRATKIARLTGAVGKAKKKAQQKAYKERKRKAKT